MADAVTEAIERFLKSARAPVLMEPGEDPLAIAADCFALKTHGSGATIECWSESRNLVRRARRVISEKRGRIELEIERFGSRTGTLALIDLADPSNREADRRGARLKYREVFRRSLRRQFPAWRIAELSTEADLHHSLSPSYPRALLRNGSRAMAAIGAAADSLDPERALSFGIIWLDYLRHREKSLAVEGLAIFVPPVAAPPTCHRVRYLDPNAARWLVFVHGDGGQEDAVDPGDYTNFDTRLHPCRRPLGDSRAQLIEWVDRISRIEGIERLDRPDGSVSLAVRGIEFARASSDELWFGIDRKHTCASRAHLDEIEQLAIGLARMRRADAADRANPLYMRHPEAWLESEVRRSIEQIDATLHPGPVYGQIPQFAGCDRGVIDLLACDRDGRLAVIEIKAAQDIHLPLQALDYWMRVAWHLERDEFAGRGYFPGIPLMKVRPRLLLVAPALEFHPANETVLRHFLPWIEVERIGVGVEWRQDLRVMFRTPARRIDSTSWPLR